jgi:elongation factor G
MGTYDVDKIRNIAVVAHGGAGKTSLCESMLYNGKVTDRLCSVDAGNSVLDYDPEEIKRKITLSSSIAYLDWSKHLINIVDTPGYANFMEDTKVCMKACGGALVIISAVSGVKVQTETVWNYAEEYQMPRIIFINKMDRERANFERAIGDIENILKVKPLLLQIPIGIEESFKGVIDLLEEKAYIFEEDASGKFKKTDIPDEYIDQLPELKEKMIENIVEVDDNLLEKYLGGEEITLEELVNALKEGTLTRKFVPVLCGSATKNIGIHKLLDYIVSIMPNPLQKASLEGFDKKENKEVFLNPDINAPFTGIVFKTISDPYTGKITIFRVFSGKVNSDETVLNSTKDTKERLGQLYKVIGKKLVPITSAVTGDIVAVTKLKETLTGDILCDTSSPVVIEWFKPSEPVISYSIVPKSKGDEEKVSAALQRLMEEDPSLHISRDPQTKELLVSGMGQVHIEVIVEKLKRKFGVDVELKTPKVPYRETITKKVKVQGKYKKQSGGRGQYGDVWIEIEPLETGKGFEFVDKIVGGVIPKQYIPAVEKGVYEAMTEGVLAGYPVVDVKVTLFDGSHHSVDSSEMAFKIAGSMAFKKAAKDAGMVLLEPIMDIEVVVPDDVMGDVIGDLNSRRGKVVGVEPQAHSNQLIKAKVPMSEVLEYAPDLRSLTGGRGMFTMRFSHYEKVPPFLTEKIVEEKQKASEE